MCVCVCVCVCETDLMFLTSFSLVFSLDVSVKFEVEAANATQYYAVILDMTEQSLRR